MRKSTVETNQILTGVRYDIRGELAARAVVMQQQDRGVMDVTADDILMGNGVSECIDLALRAMLNSGDEILLPSPDYPLWSASVALNHGTAVYYHCLPKDNFQPDPDEIRTLIRPHTRAIVLINPNNPTGAVYCRELLENKYVLIAPGSSFNVPYRNHIRLTMLPTGRKMETVFERLESMLESMLDTV